LPARTKINAMMIEGSIVIAAVVGGVCRSWTVFFATAGSLIALAVYAGDIRPTSRRR
jgi:hypothetical protein